MQLWLYSRQQRVDQSSICTTPVFTFNGCITCLTCSIDISVSLAKPSNWMSGTSTQLNFSLYLSISLLLFLSLSISPSPSLSLSLLSLSLYISISFYLSLLLSLWLSLSLLPSSLSLSISISLSLSLSHSLALSLSLSISFLSLSLSLSISISLSIYLSFLSSLPSLSLCDVLGSSCLHGHQRPWISPKPLSNSPKCFHIFVDTLPRCNCDNYSRTSTLSQRRGRAPQPSIT